jgi:hypothetical protein
MTAAPMRPGRRANRRSRVKRLLRMMLNAALPSGPHDLRSTVLRGRSVRSGPTKVALVAPSGPGSIVKSGAIARIQELPNGRVPMPNGLRSQPCRSGPM